MSFLLDALRKSEDQKRAGRVPTIHDAESLAPRRTRPRWGLAWPVLVLVALLLAWYGWGFFGMKGSNGEEGGMAADPGEGVSIDGGKPAQDNQVVRGPQLPTAPQAMIELELNAERTPVEDYSAAEDPVAEEGDSMQAIAADTATVVPDAIEVDAADDLAQETEPAESVEDTADYRKPTMSEISYWSLPQSLRSEITQPKITVLVFAERPEDRFVLMNGRRLKEGDEVSPGLVLEEIRREGAIFSYRLYRFLVSR